jgi:hypothetical protein
MDPGFDSSTSAEVRASVHPVVVFAASVRKQHRPIIIGAMWVAIRFRDGRGP